MDKNKMKQINMEQQPLENQMQKRKDKANTVFLKLLAKQKKGANPFNVTRSYTPPQTNTKPGEVINDTV